MIDEATVTALLAAHLDASLRCERVSRAAVGNGQETWLIDAVDGNGTSRPLVLRRSAPAGVLDDTDRAVEFTTLEGLAGEGLPTPGVHWLETSPDVLGRPFFVMDRLPGSPPAPRSAADAAAIAFDLGRKLARLHALPLRTSADDSRALTLREVDRWKQRYLRRRVSVIPVVGALLAWLETNAPVDGTAPCLLWGDAGPHNVLVDGTTISAMLDWELSHVGDPMEDLGAAVWACLGGYPQDQVLAGYEAESGRPVDRDLVAYYAVLGCVSRSVMQFAGIESFVSGSTHALNLAGLGLTLPIANLRRAASYAGWPDAEVAVGGEAQQPDEFRLRPDVDETLDGIARFLAEDVLPATEAAHLKRGLKTAVSLLRATGQRSREEPGQRAALGLRLQAAMDRLAAAGLDLAGRDAAALEAAAVRIESDPALATYRDDLRRVLLTDLVARSAPLSELVALYGRDVTVGPAFHH
jgi:aminoglycoside phosphotransferase (APT) family kinase protein